MSRSGAKHSQRIIVILVVVAALVAAAGAALFLADAGTANTRPADIKATYIPGGKPVGPFSLQDHNGAPFTEDRLTGDWQLVFFGYTHCPDVCPNTLAVMASAWRKLEEQGQAGNAQVVFVSVDPERDSIERLGEYVPYFHDSFLGVTGAPEQIDKLTDSLGVYYDVHDDSDDPNYLVDHSSALLLINPKGQMQALFRAPHEAGTIVKDFITIRRFYNDHT